MEMKKMWIEIFQLKRSFIVPDLLFSYNACVIVRDEFYSRVYDVCIRVS